MERKTLWFAAVALLIVGLAITGCEGGKKEETARLKKENEKLRKELAQLQARVDRLNDDVLMDKAQARVRAELLDDEVQRLTTELTWSKANRKAHARLKETIRELTFDQIELKNVIQFLRDIGGVGTYVQWTALNAKGINKSTAITIDLKSPTLEEALNRILDDVGKKAKAQLGFRIHRGRIWISTKEGLEKWSTTEPPWLTTKPTRRPPPRPITGRVTSIRDDPTNFNDSFAVIEVAQGEGVKPGMEFIIHRGQIIVAHLVVKEAAGNRAAGIIARETVRVRKGDGAVLISQTPVTKDPVVRLRAAYRARFTETIRELNFEGIEFKDVIQFIRDVGGMSIYVKWSVLNGCGIDKSDTIDLHIENVSLEEAMKEVLARVSQGAKDRLVFCLPEPAGITGPDRPTITTMDDLRRMGTLEDHRVRVVRLMDVGSEEANRAAHKALAQPVEKVDLEDVTVVGALDWVANAGGLKIDVNWTALNEAGLGKKTTINVWFERNSLEKALLEILGDAGGATKLAYRLDNGKLIISTLKDLSKKRSNR